MARSGVLLVVGSNPPSQTSGERTLRRVEVARQILGFDEARLVNLFAMPSYRSSGLGELGGSPEGWLAARGALDHGIMVAEAVVLAYGTQIPSGPARPHFRDQVAWLEERIATQQLPTWWVGGAPRHPSRWHRHTSRHHHGLDFTDALRISLVKRAL